MRDFRDPKPERTVGVGIVANDAGLARDLCELLSQILAETHSIDLTAPYQFRWQLHVVHPLEVISSIRSLGLDLCVTLFSSSDSGQSGLQALRAIRESEFTQNTGLIARITQPGSLPMTEAIQAGADICVLDSDPIEVLGLGIRALTRRLTGFRKVTQITHADLRLDISSGEVSWSGGTKHLGPTPAALLAAFLKAPDQCLSRADLKQEIKNGRSMTNRSLDAQISKLKREVPWLKGRLKSIYGRGYVLSSKTNIAIKRSA